MINFIPSGNINDFYEDENINELVNISLNNLNDDVFLCILDIIAYKNLNHIMNVIDEYQNKTHETQKNIYDNIKILFTNIYTDETKKDNLRGAFLELLIFKYMNNKFSNNPCYISALDCYVETFGIKSERTVDVFAFWLSEGFISENKISHLYFEEHDIENLNKIHIESNEYLKPYIITLASKKFIHDKLTELVENSSNTWVHLANIKIISIDNLTTLFI